MSRPSYVIAVCFPCILTGWFLPFVSGHWGLHQFGGEFALISFEIIRRIFGKWPKNGKIMGKTVTFKCSAGTELQCGLAGRLVISSLWVK